MQLPLQITFRHMEPSPAVEARIRKESAKLDRFHSNIVSCHVVLEAPHGHHHQGKLYHVRLDLTAPDKEIVVNREQHDNHAHEDAYVAIRDAFAAARRQLEDYTRVRRRQVKNHETPPHGRIAQLFPAMDYGIIETADHREIYFHRNSILGSDFDKLETGYEVRFVETEGDEGPQASTVQTVGKHHVAG